MIKAYSTSESLLEVLSDQKCQNQENKDDSMGETLFEALQTQNSTSPYVEIKKTKTRLQALNSKSSSINIVIGWQLFVC